MGRNNIYYMDFRAANGHRMRLTVTPPGDPGQEVDTDLEPSWGGDPSAGSAFVRVHGQVLFKLPQGQEVGYTDLPLGVPSLPSLKLKLNLSNLSETTALQEFRSYLVEPEYEGGLIGTRTFSTNTYWELKSDQGSVIGQPFQFTPIFEGVHELGPTTKFTPRRGQKVITIEVDLTNALHVAMKATLPADAAALLTGGDYTFWKHYATVDLWWQRTSPNYTFMRGQRDLQSASDKRLEITLYRLSDLYHAIGKCLEQAYRSYRRRSDRGLQIHSHATNDTYSGNVAGTAYDTFILYEQGYVPSGDVGNVLAHTNRWILGLIWPKNEPTNYVGGYLSEASGKAKTGFLRWTSIHQYFETIVKGGVGKMIVQPSSQQITLYMGRIRETPGGEFNALSVSRSSFITDDPTWETGHARQKGGACEVIGTIGDEEPNVVVKDGEEDEPDISVQLDLNNWPDGRDWTQWWPSPNFISGGSIAIWIHGFRENTIYYRATPPGASEEFPIRASHYTGHHNGLSPAWDTRRYWSIPAPSGFPAGWTGDDQRKYDSAVRQLAEQVLTVCIQMQAESCISYAAAAAIPREFGNPMQVLYDGEVQAGELFSGRLSWKDLGRRVSATAWPNANIFLENGETWCAAVQGKPILLRTQDSFNTGKVKVKFFAFGDGA